MKITKYFPHLVFFFASLSILLSVRDFIEMNVIFGIINMTLGMGGLIFGIQLLQGRTKHYSHKKAHYPHKELKRKNNPVLLIGNNRGKFKKTYKPITHAIGKDVNETMRFF